MKNLIAIITLLSVLSACKTNKQVAESSAKATQEPELKPIQPAATNALKSAAQDNRLVEIMQRSQSLPDSVLTGIERTACYGRCPVYTFTIYKSGLAVYQGIRFTEKTGKYVSRISAAQLQETLAAMKKLNYPQLSAFYDRGATDLPSTYTFFNFEREKRVILNRQSAPETLNEYERNLDKLSDSLIWTKVE